MVTPLGKLFAVQTGLGVTEASLAREAVLPLTYAAIRKHDPKIARAAREN